MNVLIVDDDEDDRDLFCDALHTVDQTINCLMARNGEEAINALKTEVLVKPDLIFLDLNMPRVNGTQFLCQLKQHPTLNTIPVVIYTASKLDKDKELTKQLGAVHFVTKPTSLEELFHEIEVSVSKAKVAS